MNYRNLGMMVLTLLPFVGVCIVIPEYMIWTIPSEYDISIVIIYSYVMIVGMICIAVYVTRERIAIILDIGTIEQKIIRLEKERNRLTNESSFDRIRNIDQHISYLKTQRS